MMKNNKEDLKIELDNMRRRVKELEAAVLISELVEKE